MSTTTIILLIALIRFSVWPSLKDRVISINRLYIMPIIFLVMLYDNLKNNLHMNLTSFAIIACTGIIGCSLGILLRLRSNIVADHQNQLLKLKGTYLQLILFVLIFSAEFIFHALLQMQPEIIQPGMLQYSMIAVLCLISTLPTGGNLCLLIKYHKADSQNLQSTITNTVNAR